MQPAAPCPKGAHKMNPQSELEADPRQRQSSLLLSQMIPEEKAERKRPQEEFMQRCVTEPPK
jgi:hypothetical protein